MAKSMNESRACDVQGKKLGLHLHMETWHTLSVGLTPRRSTSPWEMAALSRSDPRLFLASPKSSFSQSWPMLLSATPWRSKSPPVTSGNPAASQCWCSKTFSSGTLSSNYQAGDSYMSLIIVTIKIPSPAVPRWGNACRAKELQQFQWCNL